MLWNRLVGILLCFIVVVQANWVLTFNDEFDGQTKLNTAAWNVFYHFSPTTINSELQYYSPEGLTFGSTFLRILGEKFVNNGVTSYQSAVITTKNKFTQTYGYFEMRAILPAGQGLWPAFWLLHQDTSSAGGITEIDVLEVLGHEPNKIYMTYHCNANTHLGDYYIGNEMADGQYHTYGVQWSTSALTFYIDGVQRYTVSQCIPNQPMYILANLAIGGSWPQNPDGTTPFPAYMDIDYIRAYQYVSTGGITIPGPGVGVALSNPTYSALPLITLQTPTINTETVAAGATIILGVTIKAGSPGLSNANFGYQIWTYPENPGTSITSGQTAGVTLSAGQTRTFSYTVTLPSNLANGYYRVSYGAWDSSWNNIFWENTATIIGVNKIVGGRSVAASASRTPTASISRSASVSRSASSSITRSSSVSRSASATKTPLSASPTPSRTPSKTVSFSATSTTASSNGWQLVFSDEFNSQTRVNTAAWNVFYYFSPTVYNNELEYYSADSFSFGTSSYLRLIAQQRSYAGSSYTSGIITTKNKFYQAFGYFEIRARFPTGKGYWPAFWLSTQDPSGTSALNVVDLIGSDSSRVNFTVHCNPTTSGSSSLVTSPSIADGNFHVYGLQWTPTALKWYLDGVERFSYTTCIPNAPMYLVANLAVGGTKPGSPDGTTTFPGYYDIDYIRAYKYVSTGGVSITGPGRGLGYSNPTVAALPLVTITNPLATPDSAIIVGSSVSLTSTLVVGSGGLSNVFYGPRIFRNSDWTQVGEFTTSSVTVAAGQSRSFSYTWTVPSLANGYYTISYGVWDSSWGTIFWEDSMTVIGIGVNVGAQ